MNKVYLDEEIYYIDNFLSQLELDFLKNLYKLNNDNYCLRLHKNYFT